MIDIVDGAAVLIALAALFLSVKEAKASAEQRRISVRPRLSFTRQASEDKATFRIIMRNTGLGPAEINQFHMSVAGVPHVILRIEQARAMLKNAGINSCYIDNVAHTVPGEMIAAGQSLLVLDLSKIVTYDGKEDLYNHCFSNINVHVTYQSMYGETYEASADGF